MWQCEENRMVPLLTSIEAALFEGTRSGTVGSMSFFSCIQEVPYRVQNLVQISWAVRNSLFKSGKLEDNIMCNFIGL